MSSPGRITPVRISIRRFIDPYAVPLILLLLAAVAALTYALVEARGDLAQATEDIGAKEKQTEEEHSNLQQVEGERDGLEATFDSLQAERDFLYATVESLQAERNGLEETVYTLQAERDGFKGTVETLRAERDGLEGTVETLRAERNGLEETVESLRAERNGLEARVESLQGERDGLEATVASVQAERDVLDATVNSLQGEREGFKATVESVQAERDVLDATVESLLGERDGLEETVESVQAERDDLDATVDSLRAERDGLEAAVRSLRTERDGLEAAVASLRTERDGVDATVNALQAERDVLEATVETLEGEQDRLAASYSVLSDENSGLKATLQTLEVEKRGLETQVEDLRLAYGSLTTLETRVEGLRAVIAGLEDDRKALQVKSSEMFPTCTGSMEPKITCLDTVVLLQNFRPADITVDTVISFYPPNRAEADGDSPVLHRVTDIKIEDDVYYFWPKGDALDEPDGHWVPEGNVAGYVIELQQGTRQENSALRERVNGAKGRYVSATGKMRKARDNYDVTVERHCGSLEAASSCITSQENQFAISAAYNAFIQAWDQYLNAVCEYDKAYYHGIHESQPLSGQVFDPYVAPSVCP